MSLKETPNKSKLSRASFNNDVDVENNMNIFTNVRVAKNRDVWYTFKFVEMIVGIICLTYHINGTLYYIEPQPHTVYFCGTFVGFIIISIYAQLRMLFGASTPPVFESLLATVASIAYFFCSFASMYHAEKDFHLMYLSDDEETNHTFFVICKKQSIASLVCGSIYLLHAVYAIDSCIIRENNPGRNDPNALVFSTKGPIQLHLFFRPWLENIKFFRHFYKRIDTLEAVAVWKQSRYQDPENDEDLGPGIKIYAFEEPIFTNQSLLDLKSKSQFSTVMLSDEIDEIDVNKIDKDVQVNQDSMIDFDAFINKTTQKKQK